jgi:glycosyltransferase involved in cell wall biosynthesis
MPMKNTVQWVGAAVHSVLRQDFEDLELIIVDDRSTDGSRELVASIADERVRLLTGPGRGAAAAWNMALDAASGQILFQCDSDDLFPEGRIRRQVRFLDEHPQFGAVAGAFSTMDTKGRAIAELWDRTSCACEITSELLTGTTRTSLCTFAIRRELLVALGGKREYFESAEDIDLQLRLAEMGRVC